MKARLAVIALTLAVAVTVAVTWLEGGLPPEAYLSRGAELPGHDVLILVYRIGNLGAGLAALLIPALLVSIAWKERAWRVRLAFPVIAAEILVFMALGGVVFVLRWIGSYVANPWFVGAAIAACALSGMVATVHLWVSPQALADWLAALGKAQEVAGRKRPAK